MNNKALLQDWQRTLRALSSVVDLFVAGDLVQPVDGGLLDRLESAEVASRQAYHDSLHQAAPGAAASGQLPPGSARSAERGLLQRFATSASGGETGSSVKPSVSSSSRPGLVRRTTGQSGALPAGIGSVMDARLLLPYVSQALVALPDSPLQQQWWTLQGEVLAKQPQAKQSATTFRSQLLVAGAGTAVGTPFGTELNKLVPLIDHLITLLAHRGH
jgi:hypothetical protein